MKKFNQACKISRIIGEKILRNNYLAKEACNPQKIIIIINILINLGESKHFVAQQMQNYLWQGDVQPPQNHIYILIHLSRA